MTALLVAKRIFLEKIGVKDCELMFDRDNPTIEEEILQEGLIEVLVKPKHQILEVSPANDENDGGCFGVFKGQEGSPEFKKENEVGDTDEPSSPKFGNISVGLQEESKESSK